MCVNDQNTRQKYSLLGGKILKYVKILSKCNFNGRQRLYSSNKIGYG